MTFFGAGLPRLAAVISLGLVMAASGYAQAGEVTPSSVNGFQHFFDCFGAMINDGQAHQENCSPGNAAGPGNGSLGSFSGGATTCVNSGMIAPLVSRPFDVASLGDDFDYVPPAPRSQTLASLQYCCGGVSLSAPAFETYQTASLDDSIGTERWMMGQQNVQLATSCDQ